MEISTEVIKFKRCRIINTRSIKSSSYIIGVFISAIIIWLIWLGIDTSLAEPHISINNFSSSDSVIHEDDINKDITFNFTVFNDGEGQLSILKRDINQEERQRDPTIIEKLEHHLQEERF